MSNTRWHWSANDRIFCGLLVLCCLAKTESTFHRKFEYKLSFKGPHLIQTDGTIPFWEHFGSMHLFLMLPYVMFIMWLSYLYVVRWTVNKLVIMLQFVVNKQLSINGYYW